MAPFFSQSLVVFFSYHSSSSLINAVFVYMDVEPAIYWRMGHLTGSIFLEETLSPYLNSPDLMSFGCQRLAVDDKEASIATLLSSL